MALKGFLTLLVDLDDKGFRGKLDKNKRHMKSMKSMVQGLSRTLGGLGVAFSGAMAAADVIRRVTAFDKAMVNLSAILRTSRGEMEALEQQAIALGSATIYTASQVGELQTVLARFGFSQTEIENSTAAVLDLAAAAGIETAQAADIAAQSLRAFGLDASEMTRVVDVMTNAFTQSALDVESFGEAMKFAAPIAASTGTTIEETAAMLAILADNGLRGSIAGTSLRRIFTELSEQGKSMQQVFEEAGGSTEYLANSLNFADDAVGKYALSSFLILTKNNQLLEETTREMAETGSAAQVAGTQLESLSAKVTIMKSAWEGLVLTLEDGEGAIGQAAGKAIEDATEVLTALRNLVNQARGEATPGETGDVEEISRLERELRKLGVFAALAPTGIPLGVKMYELLIDRVRWYNDEIEKANKNVQTHADHVAEQTTFFEEQQRKIAEAGKKAVEEEAQAALKANADKEESEEKFRKEQDKLREKYQEQLMKDRAAEEGYQIGRIVHLNKEKGIYEEIWAITKRIAELPPPMTGSSEVEEPGMVSDPTSSGMFNLDDYPDLIKMIEAIQNLGGAYSDLALAAIEAGQAIGMSLAQGASSYEQFGKAAVDAIFQVIAAMIMEKTIAATSALGPFAAFAIPVAVGAAIGLAQTAKNQLFSSFAEGGIVKSPTLGLVGEYSGASRNPEIIAPLSDLQKYMGGMGGNVNVTGEFVLKNRTLVAAVEREVSRSNRYGGGNATI